MIAALAFALALAGSDAPIAPASSPHRGGDGAASSHSHVLGTLVGGGIGAVSGFAVAVGGSFLAAAVTPDPVCGGCIDNVGNDAFSRGAGLASFAWPFGLLVGTPVGAIVGYSLTGSEEVD